GPPSSAGGVEPRAPLPLPGADGSPITGRVLVDVRLRDRERLAEPQLLFARVVVDRADRSADLVAAGHKAVPGGQVVGRPDRQIAELDWIAGAHELLGAAA